MFILLRLTFTFVACLAAGAASAQGGAPGGAPVEAQGGGPAGAQGGPPPAEGGYPVIYRGREIVRIYRDFGVLTAEERAQRASERIDSLVRDLSFDPSRIEVAHGESSSELVYGDRVLGAISDDDAAALGVDRRAVAQQIRDRMVQVIATTREEFSLRAVSVGMAWASLATLVLVALLILTVRLSRRARARVEQWYESLVADARVGRAAAGRATRVRALVRAGVRMAALAVGLILVALWVQVTMTVLPWSRPFAQQIYQYLSRPVNTIWDAFIGAVPNAFFLGTIALVTYAVMRSVRLVFDEIQAGNIRFASFPDEWAQPTYKLLRVLLLGLALVAAFPYIPGSASPAFQGISLFFGLLVSLSSSSALSNIIAGTILTYTRAFKLGDMVRIGDTFGEVTDRHLLVTRVRTPKNLTVSIPNSLILAAQVLNYTTLAASRGLVVHTSVTIGYDAPWRQVHDLLVQAALKTSAVAKEPSPFVLQTALNDFSVAYEINAHVQDAATLPRIYSELHAHIQDVFNEAGVEIMSPNFLALRDGNRQTIPEAQLPPGYQPPSFRVTHVD